MHLRLLLLLPLCAVSLLAGLTPSAHAGEIYGVRSRRGVAVVGEDRVAVATRRRVAIAGEDRAVVAGRHGVVATGPDHMVVAHHHHPHHVVTTLPRGYIRVVPAGSRVIVYRGYNCYFVGGIYYRPVIYQGTTVYVVVN